MMPSCNLRILFEKDKGIRKVDIYRMVEQFAEPFKVKLLNSSHEHYQELRLFFSDPETASMILTKLNNKVLKGTKIRIFFL